MQPLRRVRPGSLPVSLVAVLGLAMAGSLLTAGTATAAGRADLEIVSAAVSGRSVAEGARLTVSHTVRNSGTARAAASTTRFHLTRDPADSLAARRTSRTNPRSAPLDVLLEGSRRVAAVRPGARARPSDTRVTVPVGTPTGRWTVLACADDRGVVPERDEGDNCRAAGSVTVTAAPRSGQLRLATFADSLPWPAHEGDSVSYLKLFCQATVPARRMALGAARTSVRRMLVEQAGADAMRQLEESGLARTAGAAQRLATTAISQDSPGLALAATLRAHELEPRNAGHLVNLAGLAVSVGLPNEALAFLDATAGRDLRRPASGVPQQAVAAVARGQAELLTGRTGAAERSFLAAAALSPLLSEADAGLANVAACRDDDAAAARFLRRSRQRTQTKVPPTVEPVRPPSSLDLRHGRATPLRRLPIAETPRQGVVMEPVYDAIAAGFGAEIDARNHERDTLAQHLRDTDSARTPAERKRRDSIRSLAAQVHSEPEVRALNDRMLEVHDELLELRERWWGGGTGEEPSVYGELAEDARDACRGEDDYSRCYDAEINRTCRPALVGAHHQWRGLVGELQNAADAWLFEVSMRTSAHAANLLDEEAYRLVLIGIEGQEMGAYAGLVQEGQLWTHYERLYEAECVEPAEVEPLEDEDPAAARATDPCPPELRRIDLVIPLGVTTIKVNCERIQQEVAVPVVPLISAFAEVSYHFRAGTVTVVGGSKLGGKVGGVVDAGFKSGVYLTMDTQGGFKDVGWRVGPSVTVGSGPVEFTAHNSEMDVSFVAGLRGVL